MISKWQVELSKGMRKIKAVNVKCTVILQNGDEKSTVATIAYNKINQLGGNGLTGKALYDLAKRGRCETEENGVKFIYEIVLPAETKQDVYVPSPEAIAAAETAEAIDLSKDGASNEESKTVV